MTLALAGAAWLFVLGPLTALATRAMPVWLLTFAVLAAIALCRSGGFQSLAPDGVITTLRRKPVVLAATGLTLWAGVSIAWSPSSRAPLTALEIAYTFGAIPLILAWWRLLNAREQQRWLRWFAVGLAIGAGLFVEEALLGYPLYQLWTGPRSLETIISGNVTKRAAAVLALLSWPLALWAGRRYGRRAAFAVPLLALAVCLLSTSRTSVFGLAVGVLAAGIALKGWAGALRRTLTAACVVAFVLAVPAGHWLAQEISTWGTDGYFRSALHRMEIWGHAAERIERKPALGYGIDASRVLPKENETSRFIPLEETVLPLHPHNLYLQVWLELGAVGAFFGAALMAGLIAATRRLQGMEAALALGLLAGGIAMASEAYGIWQAWWMCGFAAAGLLMTFQVSAVTDKARPAP